MTLGNYSDAKFLLRGRNSYDGSLIPVVKLIKNETISERQNANYLSASNTRTNLHVLSQTADKIQVAKSVFRKKTVSDIIGEFAKSLDYVPSSSREIAEIIERDLEAAAISPEPAKLPKNAKRLYLSILAAFVDQTQELILSDLKEKVFLDPYANEIVKEYWKEDVSGQTGSQIEVLNKNNDGSTPISGDKGKSENRLETTLNITPVFEGALNRAFFAEIMQSIVDQPGWSLRRASDVAGTSIYEIRRVKDGTATIDKCVEILGKFGFSFSTKAEQEPREP